PVPSCIYTLSLHDALPIFYTLMGKLRGQQLDDTGFVFFEQAIELSRALERSPAISARVYVEYGLFKNQLGSTRRPAVITSAPARDRKSTRLNSSHDQISYA